MVTIIFPGLFQRMMFSLVGTQNRRVLKPPGGPCPQRTFLQKRPQP